MTFSPPVFNPATDMGQDFTVDKVINPKFFPNVGGPSGGRWASGSKPTGLLQTMGAATGWLYNAIQGITVAGSERNVGDYGYGTFYIGGGIPIANKTQGPGVNWVLWRADNKWLQADMAGVITEVDIMEAWNKDGTGTATFHFYDPTAPGHNGQIFVGLGDMTGTHHMALQWFKDGGGVRHMRLFKDGFMLKEIIGAQVPAAAIDGGCDYSLGSQVIEPTGYTQSGLPTVQLNTDYAFWRATIDDISGGVISVPPAPVAPVTTAPVTSVPVTAPAAPAAPVPPSMEFTATQTATGVHLSVVKAVGSASTLRLYLTGGNGVETPAGVFEHVPDTTAASPATMSEAIAIPAGPVACRLTVDGMAGATAHALMKPYAAAAPAETDAQKASVTSFTTMLSGMTDAERTAARKAFGITS